MHRPVGKNFFLKLGCANTGAAHILVFNSLKARYVWFPSHGVAFFVRSNSGRAILSSLVQSTYNIL